MVTPSALWFACKRGARQEPGMSTFAILSTANERAARAARDATRRLDVARRVSALAGEFFGGIWFKIFTERGPCLRPSSS
jgi:hypothetical protein